MLQTASKRYKANNLPNSYNRMFEKFNLFFPCFFISFFVSFVSSWFNPAVILESTLLPPTGKAGSFRSQFADTLNHLVY